MISGIDKVVVPCDDQARAKEFWTTRMGFEVATDERYGDERWIEVRLPGQSVALVLSRRPADQPRREVDARLPHSDVLFTCADIQETHRELTERGVAFPQPPTEMPFGWWAMFEDADGTRYALSQG